MVAPIECVTLTFTHAQEEGTPHTHHSTPNQDIYQDSGKGEKSTGRERPRKTTKCEQRLEPHASVGFDTAGALETVFNESSRCNERHYRSLILDKPLSRHRWRSVEPLTLLKLDAVIDINLTVVFQYSDEPLPIRPERYLMYFA